MMKFVGKLLLSLLCMGFLGSAVFAQELGADEFIVGWSADSTQLAFTSNRSGINQLYIVDTSGTIVQQPLENKKILSAAWSSDGTMIAATADDSETANSVYLVKVADGTITTLPQISPNYSYLQWSPDQQWLAFPGGDNILVMNVASGESYALSATALYYPRLSWSPNSQFIAYISSNSETSVEEVMVHDVVNRQTSGNVLANYWVVDSRCCIASVEWSPDSTQLAIVPTYDANIYLADIATGVLRPAIHTGAPIRTFQWSADGSEIIYMLEWRHPISLIPFIELGIPDRGGIYRAKVADGSTQLVWQENLWWALYSPNGERFIAMNTNTANGYELLHLGSTTGGDTQLLQVDFFKNMGIRWSPDNTMLAVALCLTPAAEDDVDIYLVDALSGNAINITSDDTYTDELGTGNPRTSNCPGMG